MSKRLTAVASRRSAKAAEYQTGARAHRAVAGASALVGAGALATGNVLVASVPLLTAAMNLKAATVRDAVSARLSAQASSFDALAQKSRGGSAALGARGLTADQTRQYVEASKAYAPAPVSSFERTYHTGPKSGVTETVMKRKS